MDTDDDGSDPGRHSSPGKGNRIKKLLILGFFCLFLAACREETDLYFYTDQSWKVQSALTVDRAIVDMMLGTGGMAVGSELGVSVPASMLESDNWIGLSYDWIVAEFRNQGLDAEWTQRSNTYLLTVKGERFTHLPALSEGLILLEPVPGMGNRYHLQMEPIDIGEMDQQLAMFGLVYERGLTLHAGRIIDSNATEVRGGRAIWRNPGLVDIIFEPASPFPAPVVLTLLCGVSLIGTIALAGRKLGGKPCPSCGKRVHKGSETCPNCGRYVIDYLGEL